MTLLVVGISHRSAPLGVLEQVVLTQDDADQLAVDLVAHDAVAEAIVVATCNRVEIYADVARFHPAFEAVAELTAKRTGCDRVTLVEHSYVHFDGAAVAHLFSVAAGLDSMVVGESQILGQLRASLGRGQEWATAGRTLNGVGQQALRVGKRVHAETGIDRAGASVVSVGLDVATQAIGGLPQEGILVIGAGAMGALATSTLVTRGARGIHVASRTRAAALRLAGCLPDVAAIEMSDLTEVLPEARLVVCCTGAQGTVIDVGLAAAARGRGREGSPLVLLDLAVPHDVDPDVAGLPGVTRIDLADLAGHPATAASASDVGAARAIVAQEVESFLASVAAQAVEPVLISLRAHAGGVLETELQRLRLRLAGLDADELLDVERAMRRAMAALLHQPTVRMKQLAAGPGGNRYTEALTALFDLDPSLPAAVRDPEVGPPGRQAPAPHGPASRTPRANPLAEDES